MLTKTEIKKYLTDYVKDGSPEELLDMYNEFSAEVNVYAIEDIDWNN